MKFFQKLKELIPSNLQKDKDIGEARLLAEEVLKDLPSIVVESIFPAPPNPEQYEDIKRDFHLAVEKRKANVIENHPERANRSYTLVEEASCPYCKTKFLKKRKKKGICTHCGNTFYCRKHPYNDQEVLVTEVELIEIQAETEYLRTGESLEDSRRYFEKQAAFQKMTPDEKWAHYNERLQQQAKASDFEGMSNTYFEMAYFLDGEGRFKDSVMSFALSNRSKNQSYIEKLQERYSIEKIEETLKIHNIFTAGQPKRILEQAVIDESKREKIFELCKNISFSNNNDELIYKLLDSIS